MFTAIAAGIAATAAGISAGVGAASQASTNAINEQTFYDRLQQEIDWHNQDIQEARDAATISYQRQKELLWDQRGYDAPKRQVQRLMEAGLNPNTFMEGASGTGITASSVPQSSVPARGVVNPIPAVAPDLSGLKGLGDAAHLLFEGKRVENETQLNLTNVQKIKADTAAIESGNRRAEELHIYQLEDSFVQLQKHRSDKAYTDAMTQNMFVRRQQMLIESEKTLSDVISQCQNALSARFTTQVQSADLELRAQDLQAKIKNMPLQARIQLALATGTRKTSGSKEGDLLGAEGSMRGGFSTSRGVNIGKTSSSYRNTLGSQGSSSGNSSLIHNYSGFSLSGELGGHAQTTSEKHSEESVMQIEKDVLEPMLLCMSFLEDDTVAYSHPKFFEAWKHISNYCNVFAPGMIKNFMEIQRQLQTVSNSVNNMLSVPSGQDTY